MRWLWQPPIFRHLRSLRAAHPVNTQMHAWTPQGYIGHDGAQHSQAMPGGAFCVLHVPHMAPVASAHVLHPCSRGPSAHQLAHAGYWLANHCEGTVQVGDLKYPEEKLVTHILLHRTSCIFKPNPSCSGPFDSKFNKSHGRCTFENCTLDDLSSIHVVRHPVL